MPRGLPRGASLSGYLVPIASQLQGTIISGFAELEVTDNVDIMKVPTNKTFILTNMIMFYTPGKSWQYVCVNENSLCKFQTKLNWSATDYYVPQQIHLNAGIPFAAGSTVSIKRTDGYGGRILISGYLVSSTNSVIPRFRFANHLLLLLSK